MRDLITVGLGGFLGAAGRYLLGGLVQSWAGSPSFAWGTFSVNVAGCLAIGFFGGLFETSSAYPPSLRLFLLVGLLGGFTTFSTFSFETLELLRQREILLAAAYVFGQVALGLGAAFLGFSVASSGRIA